MSKPKKIQYKGESKVVLALANKLNWLLDNYINVEANPATTATDDLTTIKIGDTVYELASQSVVYGYMYSGAMYEEHVVGGYLYNGVFYEDSGHTVAIVPESDIIYNDIGTTNYYEWDGSTYQSASAPTEIEGEEGKLYVDNAEYKIYEYDGSDYVEVSSSVSTFSELADTNIASPTAGQTIAWDNVNSKWVNVAKPVSTGANQGLNSTEKSNALSNLGLESKPAASGGTDLSLVTTGEKQTWNSKSSIDTLSDLTDTAITSPSDGQAIEYDGTTSKWVNVAKKAADTPTFSEATGTRSNIVGSGETMATILGKIKRWFTDLKDLAFIGKDGTSSTKYLRGDGTWQAFPTIPTVNDKTLTIQKNGTQVAQFTANSASDVTANITVPTGDLASVNKPSSGQTTSYLRGDGTWQTFPSIPAAQVNSDWNASSGVAEILNKPTIPTIPSNNITGSGTNGKLTKWNGANTITDGPALSSAISSQTQSTKFLREDGTWSAPSYTTNTDTKNTAGADNTTSKIFLVGPTAQTSSNGNARTYSNVNCYASGGKLYSNGTEVLTLAGSSNITGSLKPKTDDSINLGDASHAFSDVYTKRMRIQDKAYFYRSVGSFDYFTELSTKSSNVTGDVMYLPSDSDGETLATREWAIEYSSCTSKSATSSQLSGTNFTSVVCKSQKVGNVIHIYLYAVTKSVAISNTYGNLKYLTMYMPLPSDTGWVANGSVVSLGVKANGGLNFVSLKEQSATVLTFYIATAQAETAKIYEIFGHLIVLT